MTTPAPTTDEDIERQLAGEALRAPRTWRGRPLAPLSKGLRDLYLKVLRFSDEGGDSGCFHDVAILHILAEAHAETPDARLEKRRVLLAAADNVPLFRARLSLLMDELSDDDLTEARRVTDDILGLVEKAEVKPVGNAGGSASPEPIPTTTSSPSGRSPRKRAGRSTTSAGS